MTASPACLDRKQEAGYRKYRRRDGAQRQVLIEPEPEPVN